jgi:hypothetical protein
VTERSHFIANLEAQIEAALNVRVRGVAPQVAVIQMLLDVDSVWGDCIQDPTFKFSCETLMTEWDRKEGTVTYVFWKRDSEIVESPARNLPASA